MGVAAPAGAEVPEAAGVVAEEDTTDDWADG